MTRTKPGHALRLRPEEPEEAPRRHRKWQWWRHCAQPVVIREMQAGPAQGGVCDDGRDQCGDSYLIKSFWAESLLERAFDAHTPSAHWTTWAVDLSSSFSATPSVRNYRTNKALFSWFWTRLMSYIMD